MGKISDALKKVTTEREQQKKIKKQQLVEDVAKKEGENENQAKELPSKYTTAAPTFKERIESIKYDTVYVAKAKDKSGIDPRVVTYFDYSAPVSEQYRILRTNIKSYLLKEAKSAKLSTARPLASPKVFTVTSSLHSEGKTITSVNLAVTLAKDLESKVLLVDCDLRNGTVHKLLNVDCNPGLADILASDYDYSVALHPTMLKNLFVIPRGNTSENPSELLGSKKMRLIIERLKAEPLSYIIIDTPPIIPFTDAQVLGPQTDAVLLVVQAHRIQAKVVERAKDLIQQAHGKFLGFVLTQTDYYIPDFYSYHYYYRYYNKNRKS